MCSASISLRMRAGPVEHDPARTRSARRAAAAADEQLHAELGLELADLVGDVRLHRVQAVGGRGERALLGDREQGSSWRSSMAFPPSARYRGRDARDRLPIGNSDRCYRYYLLDR